MKIISWLKKRITIPKRIYLSPLLFVSSVYLLLSCLWLFPANSDITFTRDHDSANYLRKASYLICLFRIINLIPLVINFAKMSWISRLLILFFMLSNTFFVLGATWTKQIPDKLYEAYYLIILGSCCYIVEHLWRIKRIFNQGKRDHITFKFKRPNQIQNDLYMNIFGVIAFLMSAVGFTVNALQNWWEDKIQAIIICGLGATFLNISSVFAIWCEFDSAPEVPSYNNITSRENIQKQVEIKSQQDQKP